MKVLLLTVPLCIKVCSKSEHTAFGEQNGVLWDRAREEKGLTLLPAAGNFVAAMARPSMLSPKSTTGLFSMAIKVAGEIHEGRRRAGTGKSASGLFQTEPNQRRQCRSSASLAIARPRYLQTCVHLPTAIMGMSMSR